MSILTMANPHYAYQVCYKFKSTVPARSSRLAAVSAATSAATAGRRSDELKARMLLKRQLLSQQGHRGGGRGLPTRGKVPPWQRQGYRSLPA